MTEDLERIAEQIALQEEAQTYRQSHQREFAPEWYDWQRSHFAAGRDKMERMILAGNQTGKSLSGGYETAVHLTGRYPRDWPGRVLNHPVTAWALGVDAQQLRDVIQQQLLGELGADGKFSGGWIHPDEILKFERSNAQPGLVRDVQIKHLSGRKSHLSLRSYTQAQTGQSTLSFAGSRVDYLWIDEQPPDTIMGQLVARTTMGNYGAGGLITYTMTPELGLTQLVAKFLSDPEDSQYLTGPVPWEDCAHITPARREQLLAAFPPHERDMRARGVPLFGEGLVYPFAEARLLTPPTDTPDWHKRIRALDLGGMDHPTAIVWLSYDPEAHVVRLKRCYRQSGIEAAVHVQVANSMWPDTPLVVPPDINQHEKGSMLKVVDYFTNAGIRRPILFHNPGKLGEKNRHIEPGIFAIQQAMQENRFLVETGNDTHLFLEEMRSYHRQKGKIVALRDDVMDAVRYGYQMVQRYGITNRRNQVVKQTGTVNAFDSIFH